MSAAFFEQDVIELSTDYLERKISLIMDDMIKAPGSR